MTDTAEGDVHGLMVTFNRPRALEQTLSVVSSLRQGLSSLTIVDNGSSPEVESLAESSNRCLPTAYIAMKENTGPAGAIAAGAAAILEVAKPNDWIQLLDDDDPPPDDSALARIHGFAESLRASGLHVGVAGMVGARFNRRTGRLQRPADAELHGPVDVDYVAGGQLLLASVAGMRKAGTFDPDLFFGFDDLEFCLRVKQAGFLVMADGDEWMQARIRAGRVGPRVGRSARKTEAWRRYYSVRNSIVILRRHGAWGSAVLATIGHLAVRPVNDVRRHEDVWPLLCLTVRGVTDAWRNRLGRQVEPPAVAQG